MKLFCWGLDAFADPAKYQWLDVAEVLLTTLLGTQPSASKCITLGEDSQAVLRLLGQTMTGPPLNAAVKLPGPFQGAREAMPGAFGKDIGNLQVDPSAFSSCSK